MDARGAGPAGTHRLGPALRAFATTLAESFRLRGALFALEAREELKLRQRVLALAVLAAVLFHLALLLATALTAAIFWDTHRHLALGAMAALYLAAGAAVLAKMRGLVNRAPLPFSATLGELERDLASSDPSP
jgi:uncharacterized membrane protein YqjE